MWYHAMNLVRFFRLKHKKFGLQSVQARYLEILGKDTEFPEGGYEWSKLASRRYINSARAVLVLRRKIVHINILREWSLR